MGIRAKYLLLMSVLCLLAIISIAIVSYKLNVGNAIFEARSKSQLILDWALSSKKHVKLVQRPLVMALLEKDRFYPELMSGFAVARGTYEIFKKKQPGYEFKQATLDPLEHTNIANADEVRIINTFRENPELKIQEGIINKDGEEHFYLAKPIKVDMQKCLDCHGDPGDAPKDQIEIYGSKNGYNWKLGDIVATFVVYVPIKEAMAYVRHSTMYLGIIGAGSLIIVLFCFLIFLERSIVAPIKRLSKSAEEMSLGKNLERNISSKASYDEIGELGRAIDRLRISIAKMLKRSSHD